MIIHCEYCGAQFNIENHNVCPECGASFDKNKYAFEIKENKRKNERLEQESKRLANEAKKAAIEQQKAQTEYTKNRTQMQKKASKTAKFIALIIGSPFILIAALIAISIFLGIIMGIYTVATGDDSWMEEDTEIVEVVEDEKEPNFYENSGIFNEPVSNGIITVTIDEIKEVDPYPFKADKDHMYVIIHFLVENISEKEYEGKSSIYCLADGIMMDSKWVNDYKELYYRTIPKGMKVDGYLSFQVPIAAEELEIQYGEYITIKIPNAKQE